MHIGNMMRISTRIYSGFLILLALFLSIAVMAYHNGNMFAEQFTRYEASSSNQRLVASVDASVIDLRRYVHRYLDAPTQESIANVQAAIAKTKGLVERAKTEMHETADLKTIQGIYDAVDLYGKQFQKLTEIASVRDYELSAKNGVGVIGPDLQIKLRNYIAEEDKAGRKSQAILAGQALEALMTTRLYTSLYLGIHKEDYKDQAMHWMQAFKNNMQRLYAADSDRSHASLMKNLKSGADAYAASLQRVVAAVAEQAVIVQQNMPKYVQTIAKAAAALVSVQDVISAKTVVRAYQETDEQKSFTTVFTIVALFVGLAAAFVIGRSITTPLNGMTRAMRHLASGQLDADIPAVGQSDEIGQMADAVQVFKENAIRVKRMEAEQIEQERQAKEARHNAMMELADMFEDRVGHVINAVTTAATQLTASSRQLAAMATQTSSQSATVASAATEASANVETVASAAEELSAAIAEIGGQVKRSSGVSEKAVTVASEANQTISGLSSIVNEIGEVVNMINDIADQTNLLALNATIEAARAGDAGKGFAVVAGEVKNLANQTARATSDISQQIGKVQAGTTHVVSAIEDISGVISEMSEISSSIAISVEQQSAATSEIARNVELAASGTNEVSSNITDVQQAAGETNAAATQIHAAAVSLAKQADVLQGEVNSFLIQVRSDEDEQPDAYLIAAE